MPVILKGRNLEVVNAAQGKDLFLTPVIRSGFPIELHYYDGILDRSKFPESKQRVLKRSGVPLKLYTKRNSLGGFQFEHARICGHVVKHNLWMFVAQDLRIEGLNPFNMIMRINLLMARGLITVSRLCSWFITRNLDLPEIEERLQSRLAETRDVAMGRRPNFWESDLTYRGRQETPVSDSMIASLRVHDCIGYDKMPRAGRISCKGRVEKLKLAFK